MPESSKSDFIASIKNRVINALFVGDWELNSIPLHLWTARFPNGKIYYTEKEKEEINKLKEMARDSVGFIRCPFCNNKPQIYAGINFTRLSCCEGKILITFDNEIDAKQFWNKGQDESAKNYRYK